MGERAGVPGLFPVEVIRGLRLVLDGREVGDARLHPEGQLVLLDPGVRLRVADRLVIHLVELAEAVERAAADLGGDAGGVVDVKDRVAPRAERGGGVLAGKVARLPEPRRDRLNLLSVRWLGDEHDEGRQVLVERAEAVGDPGAEAGAAGDLVPGLDVGDRRFVVDRLGVHAPDEANVVDHLRHVRQHLAHPHVVLAVLGELVFRGRNRESLLPRGHRREPLALPDRIRQVLVVVLAHLGLVVVQVHLRRAADHVQVDHLLRLGGEVGHRVLRRGRRPASEPGPAAARRPPAHQRCQGGAAHGVGPPAEELPAGLVTHVIFKEVHGESRGRTGVAIDSSLCQGVLRTPLLAPEGRPILAVREHALPGG